MIMIKTEQVEEQIVKVLASNEVCSFGTTDGTQPKVRYMALFHEGMTIYLATNSKTDKVDELQQNPNVFILTGFDGKRSDEIVQLQGKAEIVKDNATREKVWNSRFKEWFDGPHDPEYVIIKIEPTRAEYIHGKSDPVVWER